MKQLFKKKPVNMFWVLTRGSNDCFNIYVCNEPIYVMSEQQYIYLNYHGYFYME